MERLINEDGDNVDCSTFQCERSAVMQSFVDLDLCERCYIDELEQADADLQNDDRALGLGR